MPEPRPSRRDVDDRNDNVAPARYLEVVEGPAKDSEFDELYRVEHLAMLRLAVLLTGDREVAAEAVQEAFMVTYERWDRLDNPGGYLRTSVVNRCTDHHRRRRRRRTRPVAEPAEVAGASVVVQSDEVLADVIAELRPRQRTAVVLRYYLDLPEAEIAALMQVRPGTVKSLLHRALAELRTVLDESDRPPPRDGAPLRPVRRPGAPTSDTGATTRSGPTINQVTSEDGR